MCFIFHKWSKWGKPVLVTLRKTHQTYTYGPVVRLDEPIDRTEWRQERACLVCNKIEKRVVDCD